MAGKQELSDQQFKTTMINILRSLMDKVDSMQEQMGNVNKERTKKKCQRSKTLTKMKNAFDGLLSRLDLAEKRISKLEDISIEISKTEKQQKKDQTPSISKNCRTNTKDVIFA